MNYEQFLKFKNSILQDRPDLINLAENNLYKYRPFNLDYDGTGHINSIVYRCHLVEDWLKFYSLPQEYKKHIGVSDGIRHSLKTLTENFKNKSYLIPKDVYPFYSQILNEKHITYKEYETLNTSQPLFSDIYNIEADILLICDPIKPLGRDIVDAEYNYIKGWLSKDKARILLVDCAYMLNHKINEYLLELYEQTQQVILMFSLSKGWSLPNCFGITMFMQNEFGLNLREKYKLLDKNQDNLNLAFMAINKKTDSLHELKHILKNAHQKAETYLQKKLPYSDSNPSYLYYLEEEFDTMLQKNILTIPASVFGGKNGVVISTLF